MESEIWRFRTRSSPYGAAVGNGNGSGNASRAAEERLQNFSELIKQHVLQSAIVLNAGFLSKFDGLANGLGLITPTTKPKLPK